MTTMTAFISYARIDREADEALIDEMKDALVRQTRAFVGDRDFDIWRDVDGIRWGDAWREKLHGVIATADLFLILLSPGWIKSAVCREEYAAILRREAGLGGPKRILVAQIRPVAESADLTPAMRAVQTELGTRQRKSWRAWLDQPPEERAKAMRAAGEEIAAILREVRSAAAKAALGARPEKPDAAAQPAPAARPRLPVNAEKVPLVSGDYYVPRQNVDAARRPVKLNLAVAGDARVETAHGSVVFATMALTIYTQVEGGRIAPAEDDRPAPPLGPGVRVAGTGGFHRVHMVESANGSGLHGAPLTPDGRPDHATLFEVETAEGAALRVSGQAEVEAEAVAVDFERSENPARLSQVRRLAALVLKRCGGGRFPLEGHGG